MHSSTRLAVAFSIACSGCFHPVRLIGCATGPCGQRVSEITYVATTETNDAIRTAAILGNLA